MCRLNKSDNALIKAVMASSVVHISRINSHWRRLLYVGTAHRRFSPFSVAGVLPANSLTTLVYIMHTNYVMISPLKHFHVQWISLKIVILTLV